MSPKLHLYLSSGSCAMASHIILQESGLPYTTTDMQLRARGGFPADQLHLNAKGKVPILDMDGELITEGLAIVSTVAALAPSKNLLGATILEKARALEWLSYITGTVHGQGFGMIFKQSRFISDESAHPAVKEKGKDTVKDCFKYIDQKLVGRKFAVGEGFTAVDAYLVVIYSWGNLMQFGMKENYPNFSRIVEQTLQMDSVKTALADEGVTVKVG